jgi:PAS domain S-box-containing protein
MTSEQQNLFVLILTAIAGGLIASWKKYIAPLFVRKKSKVEKILDVVNNMQKDFVFNGGSSIKDVIWELKKDQKIILSKLGEVEESQKLMLNINRVAFWYSDVDGNCVYASPSLVEIVGRSESEILGHGWLGFIISEDRERIYEAWNFSVENRTIFDETYTFKKSDGKLITVQAIAFHKKIGELYTGSIGKLEILNN